MGKTIRFGVSLDSDLLEKFDALCDERSYQTRSEAIRDLIRNMLIQKEWENVQGETAGTLSMVFDHHQSDLAQKLTELQHDYLDIIVASLHVHLDHNNCMEILVLRGIGERLRDLGQKLTSTKGVKHGKLTLTTTGKNLK
ncbi:MAG TPA: nickel-responsive transcriptional regulator NikR [Desulfonatronum sp.]|nr:nickel-responsive transcriptional regulator NikR [Desulfonatronum sp.]